jgi:hypothetical protein
MIRTPASQTRLNGTQFLISRWIPCKLPSKRIRRVIFRVLFPSVNWRPRAFLVHRTHGNTSQQLIASTGSAAIKGRATFQTIGDLPKPALYNHIFG